ASGSGTISTGIADQNVAGTATNPTLTGTYTAPTTGDGRTSITLNPSGTSAMDLAAYVVSAGEFLAMRTDTFSSDGLLRATIQSLVDKNQAFILDTSPNVGFGFVERQGPAPSGGFKNSSFSGTFSAGTVAPSITANVGATGLAMLDGAGNFSESASASTLS